MTVSLFPPHAIAVRWLDLIPVSNLASNLCQFWYTRTRGLQLCGDSMGPHVREIHDDTMANKSEAKGWNQRTVVLAVLWNLLMHIASHTTFAGFHAKCLRYSVCKHSICIGLLQALRLPLRASWLGALPSSHGCKHGGVQGGAFHHRIGGVVARLSGSRTPSGAQAISQNYSSHLFHLRTIRDSTVQRYYFAGCTQLTHG